MKTSKKGIELIKKFEGCKLKAYLCPANVWTIGYGNTYYENLVKVKAGDVITQARADELLLSLLPKYEAIVKKYAKVELTQNQFDALVSFCWNCGYSETLFRLVNLKSIEIGRWWQSHYITGGGIILQGLVKRRLEESKLFLSL